MKNLMFEAKKRKVTYADIAETLGLAKRTICNRMWGKGKYSVADIKKLQEKYFPDCSIEYLSEE